MPWWFFLIANYFFYRSSVPNLCPNWHQHSHWMMRLLLFLPPTVYICICVWDWHQNPATENWHEEKHNSVKLREVWHGFHLRNPVVLMASHSLLLCVIKLSKTNNYRDQFNLPLNHNASIAQCKVRPGANCVPHINVCVTVCDITRSFSQINMILFNKLVSCYLLLVFCWSVCPHCGFYIWLVTFCCSMSKCWNDLGWSTNFI